MTAKKIVSMDTKTFVIRESIHQLVMSQDLSNKERLFACNLYSQQPATGIQPL